MRLIALSFYALAVYVAVRSVLDLFAQTEPQSSPVGIGLAIASLIVMPALAASEGLEAWRRELCAVRPRRKHQAPASV